MATRSLIGVVKEDNTVEVIYCHWDGYPTYVGAQLALNYYDKDTIQLLMDLGDRSSLGGMPTTDTTYAVTQNQEIKPRIFANMLEFLTSDKMGAEFAYIHDGEWEVFTVGYDESITSLGVIESLKVNFIPKKVEV
jgi:hypothetical protein